MAKEREGNRSVEARLMLAFKKTTKMCTIPLNAIERGFLGSKLFNWCVYVGHVQLLFRTIFLFLGFVLNLSSSIKASAQNRSSEINPHHVRLTRRQLARVIGSRYPSI